MAFLENWKANVTFKPLKWLKLSLKTYVVFQPKEAISFSKDSIFIETNDIKEEYHINDLFSVQLNFNGYKGKRNYVAIISSNTGISYISIVNSEGITMNFHFFANPTVNDKTPDHNSKQYSEIDIFKYY